MSDNDPAARAAKRWVEISGSQFSTTGIQLEGVIRDEHADLYAVVEALRTEAQNPSLYDTPLELDDVMICGNAGDVFSGGLDTGRVVFARELVKLLDAAGGDDGD